MTYLFELFRTMSKGLKVQDLHYLSDGLRAVVVNPDDNADYEVVIKPTRQGEPNPRDVAAAMDEEWPTY